MLLGDPPLFPRHEEVELSWKILDPILEHWAAGRRAKPEPYPSGTWGPESADKMLARDGRVWRQAVTTEGPDMIELTDTNSAADRRRVRPGPHAGPAARPWAW